MNYQYVIKAKYTGQSWEIIDYAVDKAEKDELLKQYQIAFHGVCLLKAVEIA